MSDRILLEGLQFYGYHGVYPEERRLGQRFAVDVAVELDLARAARCDALDATISYGALYQTVRAVVEGEAYELLESVADAIARAIVLEYPMVQAVTVRVWKLAPPIAGAVVGRVGVEIRRTRQDYGRVDEGAAR